MKPVAAGFWAVDGSGRVTETLQTRRLVLRPMQQDDAKGLHAFFADSEATRFFSDPHTEFEQTEAWVRGTIAADPARTREFTLLRDGQAIGKAGIWSSPELGFFLRRADWNQGLMREALDALVPHLFALMSLPRMTADVDPNNAASLKLLSHLGFSETGRAARTIQIGGKWADSVYLEKPRPEG